MQADAPYRAQPEDLGSVFVRSITSREMIPLKSLIVTSNVVGPEQLERFNGFVAARVLGNGRPGVSSGEAIKAVEEVATRALPEGYSVAWSGQAFQEKRTGRQSAIAFSLAIVMVFLILAALYERWLLPFAVVFAVPFAVFGALGLVATRGLENDIYFQIGLVVLIGLAAKNAILIVEFAQQGFLEGKSATEAALNAARLRFRPIIMTSLAFVLGVMPLMLSTGAGAAARRSMGTGVVGGMLAATFIATLFIRCSSWSSPGGAGRARRRIRRSWWRNEAAAPASPRRRMHHPRPRLQAARGRAAGGLSREARRRRICRRGRGSRELVVPLSGCGAR